MVINGLVVLIMIFFPMHGNGQLDHLPVHRHQKQSIFPFELNVEYMLEQIPVGKKTGFTAKGCKFCYCGMMSEGTKIVGGWTAKANKYPWVVALKRNGRLHCAGSLINDRYIMTAAHCVRLKNKKDPNWAVKELRVVLSEHYLDKPDTPKEEIRKISKIIVHPHYGNRSLDSDIALLKLDRSVMYKFGISPICLPRRKKTFSGEWGVITGWGVTQEHGMSPEALHEAYVKIMPRSQCTRPGYGYENWQITQNMFCAGYRGIDSCQGDSGGPLMVEGDLGQYFTVGITSWGEGCAKLFKPGVYTKVNNFVDWILDNTQDACYCI